LDKPNKGFPRIIPPGRGRGRSNSAPLLHTRAPGLQGSRGPLSSSSKDFVSFDTNSRIDKRDDKKSANLFPSPSRKVPLFQPKEVKKDEGVSLPNLPPPVIRHFVGGIDLDAALETYRKGSSAQVDSPVIRDLKVLNSKLSSGDLQDPSARLHVEASRWLLGRFLTDEQKVSFGIDPDSNPFETFQSDLLNDITPPPNEDEDSDDLSLQIIGSNSPPPNDSTR